MATPPSTTPSTSPLSTCPHCEAHDLAARNFHQQVVAADGEIWRLRHCLEKLNTELNVLRPLKDNKPLLEKQLLEKEIELAATLATEKLKLKEMKSAILHAAGVPSVPTEITQCGVAGETHIAPVIKREVDDALLSARNWFADAPGVFDSMKDALSNMKDVADEREKDVRRAELERDEQRARLEEEKVGREECVAKTEERAREERLQLKEELRRIEQERNEHRQMLQEERWERGKIIEKIMAESETEVRDLQDQLRSEKSKRQAMEDKVKRLERIEEFFSETISNTAPAAESTQRSGHSTDPSYTSSAPTHNPRKRKYIFNPTESQSQTKRKRCTLCHNLSEQVTWHLKCCTKCREDRGLEVVEKEMFGRDQPCVFCAKSTFHEVVVCYERCRNGPHR